MAQTVSSASSSGTVKTVITTGPQPHGVCTATLPEVWREFMRVAVPLFVEVSDEHRNQRP